MVFSKYTDLLPKEVLNEDVPELQKPDEEAVQEVWYFECHDMSIYFIFLMYMLQHCLSPFPKDSV